MLIRKKQLLESSLCNADIRLLGKYSLKLQSKIAE